MMSVLPSKDPARRAPARRKVLTPYVMIWLAVAGFALAYLAFLGVRPDILAAAKSSEPDVKQELDSAKRDMARAFADLDPMRRTVGEIKMDVANLKDAAQSAEHRDEMIMERVVALETTAQSSAGAPEQTAAIQPSAAGRPALAPAPPPTRKPKTAAGAAAARKVSSTPAGKKSAAIETGSIEKKTTTAAKPVGVLLATGPTLDTLRLNWTILNDRHADAVGKLKPRYLVSGPVGNQTYRLVLGPVATPKQAKSLCKTLLQRGLACEVSAYRGNAM
jgi:hypothetical protein